jgi:hypothetical protein
VFPTCSRPAVLVLTAALLATAAADGVHAFPQPRPGAATVLKAWRARQNATRTLRVRWTEQITYAKGAIPNPLNPKDPVPPQTTTVESHNELALSGDKLRFATDGPQWNHEHGDFFPQKYLSTFDGQVSKSYYAPGMSHGSGFIKKEKRDENANSFYLLPLLITFRGVHASTGDFNPKDYVLTDKRGVVGGRTCVLFEEAPAVREQRRRNSRSDASASWWLDPERDFVVLRYVETEGPRPVLQFTCSYRPLPEGGWVPTGWSTVALAEDGSVRQASQCTVTHLVTNVRLDAGEFVIDFPPDTQVSDLRSGAEYLVRPGGQPRLITPAEAGATYDQLLQTESGMALRPPRSAWWRWLARANLAVLACLAASFAWRRVRAGKPHLRPGPTPGG